MTQKSARGDTHGNRAGADALAVIGIHQISKAALETAGRRQHAPCRDFQIVEADFPFRHAAQAKRHLAPRDRDAFILACNRKKAANAKLAACLVKGAGKNEMQLRDAGASDPMLAASDDEVLATAVGAGCHRGGVGAGVWLRNADGGFVAGKHQAGRELLLGVAAIVHDGGERPHIGLDHDAGGDSAVPCHLFDDDDSIKEAQSSSAPGLRDGHAHEAGGSQSAHNVPWVVAVAVDIGGARPDMRFGKGARLITKCCLLV